MASSPADLATDRRQQFIPIRRSDLIRLLAEKLPPLGSDRQHFAQLCRMLEATFHFEYHARLERLKDAYASFDPDADTHCETTLTDSERDEQAARLFGRLASLLERANYKRIGHDNICEAMATATSWGVNLDVDLEAFDLLEVYARGEAVERRSCRLMQQLYRQQEVDVPIFQRLVVAFRPKYEEGETDGPAATRIYFKMFKSIPKMDLEMLLPGTRVKMTLVDRGRIVLPALSGVSIAIYKVLTGALALAVAGATGLLTFLGLIGGTVGYGVKSLLNYQRAKDKYQLNLARNLYYQNLDNNAGVLYRLLDEAEEQEFREAILAYFLLWQTAPPRSMSPDELDTAAESLLREFLGIDIDFEVDDALDKLQRLRLVDTFPKGEIKAVPIADALCRLDVAWDRIFQPTGSKPTGVASVIRQDEAEDELPKAHRPWSSSPWPG